MADLYRKYISIPSVFNNETLLEFSIDPDKRSLLLGETYLQFYVEIPENFVPENNFGNKLFEFVDLNINFEDVSYKSSSNDYDYASYILNKISKNSNYMKKFPFEGYFDAFNYDSSALKDDSNADIVKHRRGRLFKKMIEGREYNFYRYLLILPIYHGLALEDAILPPGIHIRMTFHRAKPEKALIDISEELKPEYPDKAIQILQPVLQGCWGYGKKFDQQSSRISSSGLNLDFNSCHIRHRVLDEGLRQYQLEMIQGPFPESIIFFLMEPRRFSNDLKYSSSKFQMLGLQEFSLFVDNVEQEHYPLKILNLGGEKFTHHFYRRWLDQTGKLFEEDANFLSEADYIDSNFFIVETFTDFQIKEGHLTCSLKFESELSEKLFLCWMPIRRKTLRFDRSLSVQVT